MPKTSRAVCPSIVRRTWPVAILALALAGCTPPAARRFVGVWVGDRELITIKERGLGSRRMPQLRVERTFTWKVADADRIILEFGETTATRTEMEARLRPDGTLLLTDPPETVVLKRLPSRGP